MFFRQLWYLVSGFIFVCVSRDTIQTVVLWYLIGRSRPRMMIQPDYTTLRSTPYRNCLSENRANWQIHPAENTHTFYPRTCMSSAWISKTVNDSFEAYSESGSINNYQPYRYTVCLILSKTNPGTGYSRYTTLVCVSSYAVLIYITLQ